MNDKDNKIQELIDKESIRELVNLYCRAETGMIMY